MLALIAIAAGVGVILPRKPVHNALFLLLQFLALAGLYFLLRAPFVAVAQILVYAGAVAVLFLYVAMLVGGEDPGETPRPGRLLVAAGFILTAGWLGTAAYATWQARAPLAPASPGTVEAVGELLLGNYLLVFEGAAVLLFLALVGTVALLRKE